MRCKNCPVIVYDCLEGYEICPWDWDDDFAEDNSKGELGCKYTGKQLEKIITEENKLNEAFDEECKSFVEFMEGQEKREKRK